MRGATVSPRLTVVLSRCAMIAGGTLLALFISSPSNAQWPPWAKKTPPRAPHYPDIAVSATWLADHASERGLVILDARTEAAYETGHVPSALSLPSDSLSPEEDLSGLFALRGLSGHERVVVYGDSSSLEDAAYLFWLLETAGARDARFLDGGLDAWTRAGHPLETASAGRGNARWHVSPNPRVKATMERLITSFGQPGVEIIDARGEAEWEGAGASRNSRAGHIPHSLPFDFRQMILADGTFRSSPEMRSALAHIGPRPSEPVDIDGAFIVHGRGASDAGALGYLVMRLAGVDTVRYAPSGWNGWAADSTLPVVRIITAEQLRDRLRAEPFRFASDRPPASFVFMDVRFRLDFETPGHIPGAVNLASDAFGDSLDVTLDRYWPGIDRARTPLVIYCYGLDCIRSRICSTIAARRGFRKIEWFRGGLEEWRGIGEEISAGHR